MIKILLVLIVLALGLYFIAMTCKINTLENFTGEIDNKCPNMLIERDNKFFLYNSKMAIVPGVNPIQFDNLEDYTEFLEWQRGQGINCPVLQLQYSTDPQNNDTYRIKPNIFENQGGLPNTSCSDIHPQPLLSSGVTNIFDANQDVPPYNQGGPIGFDPENQYIGLKTPIDQIGFQGDKSPSPMDTNWGGIKYTRSHIGSNLNSNNNSMSSVSTLSSSPSITTSNPTTDNTSTNTNIGSQ